MSKQESLRILLSSYSAKNKVEEDYKARMQKLNTGSHDAFSSNNFDPGHFTASAFVLSPDQNNLLLIFHSKLQRWLQPGGHIEDSDTDVFHAARREVLEETGVSSGEIVNGELFDLDIHTIPARKGLPAHNHYDLRVLIIAESNKLCAGTDAIDAKWVPLMEVGQIESDESVMRAVRKILNARSDASDNL